jgi:hypothetical protein
MSQNDIMGITVGLIAFLLLAYGASLEDVSNCRIRMNDTRLKEQMTATQQAYCMTVLQKAAVGTPHKL